MIVPRQNGKGAILEARELAGLFLFDERLITHSAHLVDTALEHFRRLLGLIEDTPELAGQLKRVSYTNGREAIELKNGCRIRFRSRSKAAGRGFSGELLVLDEAMFLPEFAMGALKPTQSARANPQTWYVGSAVDQEVHDHGVVLARVRERGLSGEARRLAYHEWSAAFEGGPSEADQELLADRGMWQQANPGVPFRISPEAIESELDTLAPRTFAVERLGIGDWPRTDGVEETVIAVADWVALRDARSKPEGAVCVAFDVSPGRSTAIAAAGWRDDGLLHVEVTDHAKGTGWLPGRLAELVARHDVTVVCCDGYGPSASMLAACDDAGVKVKTTTAGQMAEACGRLEDLVEQRKVRHLGSDELLNAIRGARSRPLGDRWAWARRSSSVDISPLVAATLALSAAADAPVRDWVIY